MRNGIWFFLALLVICFATIKERKVPNENQGQVIFSTNSPDVALNLSLKVDGDDWGSVSSHEDTVPRVVSEKFSRSVGGGLHSYYVVVSHPNGDIAGRVTGSFKVPSGGVERVNINLMPFFE